jgi:hypothetical protein
VDNIVDKPPLTRKKPCIGAVFDKMHIPQAKVFINKINDLKQGTQAPADTNK